MAQLTGLTFGQKTWTPQFIEAIAVDRCLGCGRCYKVCGQNVLALAALDEDGEFVDPEEDEFERRVMVVANRENCIGCQACSRVCAKSCHQFSPLELN